MISSICPCCSTPLLHHLSNHREYWFCRHCWEEMPDLDIAKYRQYRVGQAIVLYTNMPITRQPLLTG